VELLIGATIDFLSIRVNRLFQGISA
jgi:hypothetical protein